MYIVARVYPYQQPSVVWWRYYVYILDKVVEGRGLSVIKIQKLYG